jgi:hypothetical protein
MGFQKQKRGLRQHSKDSYFSIVAKKTVEVERERNRVKKERTKREREIEKKKRKREINKKGQKVAVWRDKKDKRN